MASVPAPKAISHTKSSNPVRQNLHQGFLSLFPILNALCLPWISSTMHQTNIGGCLRPLCYHRHNSHHYYLHDLRKHIQAWLQSVWRVYLDQEEQWFQSGAMRHSKWWLQLIWRRRLWPAPWVHFQQSSSRHIEGGSLYTSLEDPPS